MIVATGDLEKARRIYEIWKHTYPRDFIPLTNLGGIYTQLGQYDRALAEDLESVRLDPTNGTTHADVVSDYVYLNRLGDARAAAEQALSRKLDTPKLRGKLYVIGFPPERSIGDEVADILECGETRRGRLVLQPGGRYQPRT